MKVKEKYSLGGGSEITTASLIDAGSLDYTEAHGHIETLEARVSHLTRVLASVIDRMGLSDTEVLEITGCEWQFDIVSDESCQTGREE